MPKERRAQERAALIVMLLCVIAIAGWIWSAMSRF
jgi:predicted nucleic acid-binding Zn ribbon protein